MTKKISSVLLKPANLKPYQVMDRATAQLNEWVARNPDARIISVETVYAPYTGDSHALLTANPAGLRAWVESDHAENEPC